MWIYLFFKQQKTIWTKRDKIALSKRNPKAQSCRGLGFFFLSSSAFDYELILQEMQWHGRQGKGGGQQYRRQHNKNLELFSRKFCNLLLALMSLFLCFFSFIREHKMWYLTKCQGCTCLMKLRQSSKKKKNTITCHIYTLEFDHHTNLLSYWLLFNVFLIKFDWSSYHSL